MELQTEFAQAARRLPPGWSIHIIVAKDAADVVLHRPDGTTVHLPEAWTHPAKSVNAAVRMAETETNPPPTE